MRHCHQLRRVAPSMCRALHRIALVALPSPRRPCRVSPSPRVVTRCPPLYVLPLHCASPSPHRPRRVMLQPPVASFFLFPFSLLALLFTPMYMTPRAHPFVSCRLCCVTPSPRVALVASQCPLFKCRPHPVASPHLRHALCCPSSRVASPCCIALTLSPSSRDAAAPGASFPLFLFHFHLLLEHDLIYILLPCPLQPVMCNHYHRDWCNQVRSVSPPSHLDTSHRSPPCAENGVGFGIYCWLLHGVL